MKEQEIYDSFELSEDHTWDVIDNHINLMRQYSDFLGLVNDDRLDTKEKERYYINFSDRVLGLLIQRAKIEGKDFPDFKIIDDFQIEEENDDLPIVVFINFFHRLIETPNWKHEWIEFKMLLNRYKDKI